MFNLYLYEGQLNDDFRREDLIWQATEAFCAERGIPYDMMKINLRREEKGRPYFENLPVFFSVTHSGQMWMCLMGDTRCGIDLQESGDYDFKRIASRHFNQAEQDYVCINGEEGFYRIWTRREAYGKYTGEGFYGEKPAFADENGNLISEFTVEGKKVYMHEIPFTEDIKCAYCTEEETDEIKFFG